MALTIGEARDIQAVVEWVTHLGSWQQAPGQHVDERPVAAALIRLAGRAHARLRETGQGRPGLDDLTVGHSAAVTWMRARGGAR